ncbi:MAG: universal stress protein [Bdellovibrionota bacterium]
MIKRILVAMDDSASASAALSIAGSLGGIVQAELVGVFVEDIDRVSALSGAVLAEEEQKIAAESQFFHKAFLERCESAQIEGRFLSVRGEPEQVLQERARAVDFIVLGNSGLRTGAASKQTGDTAKLILQSVARPVLVVAEDVTGESKMVVAYDGTLPSDRALRAAAEFAEISDIDALHLITVTSSPSDCEKLQAPALEYLSAYSVQVTPVCVTGEPGEAILTYIDQIDASVLVLGAFGSNKVNEKVFGSTTEAVLHQGQTAVLLVS